MILSTISWAAVYFVVWWTTLFAVLPFGARGQPRDVEPVPGADAGAPARTPLARLFVLTTIVATILFALLYVVLTQRLMSLDSVPFLPRFEKVA